MLLLGVIGLLTIGPRLGLPFVGDDYVFLDSTRGAFSPALFSPAHATDFGWYRPWSRELWFWALQSVCGPTPAPFRIASLLLWVVAGALYFGIVDQIAGRRVAWLALLGYASAALWGTPLLWISACQDLWMLVFALSSLRAFSRGQSALSLVLWVAALLSKETAAVLPIVFAGVVLVLDRRSWSELFHRTWAHLLILGAWFVVHPTLKARLLGGMAHGPESAGRPDMWATAARNISATINVDRMASPRELGVWAITCTVGILAVLLVGVWIASTEGDGQGRLQDHRVAKFGALWAGAGWLPTFLPSIGWHAYYGCFGALGAWLLVATLLRRSRRIPVLAAIWMSLSRMARAQTPSDDWGDEGYLRRAGSTLAAIRVELQRQYPQLPPGTRIYFTEIPARIGLVAGRSPAIRVWYRDSTLSADFWSRYLPRGPAERPGLDLFFRFDPERGMVEVHPGPEAPSHAPSPDRHQWITDHLQLANVFAEAADDARAATEFEKVAAVTGQLRHEALAAACWRRCGVTWRADELTADIARGLGGDTRAAGELIAVAQRELGARGRAE